MKIAQIAPPWIAIPPRNYGGTENVIYNLVEELVAEGHDITLFTTEDSHTSAKQISFLTQALIPAGVPWQAHLKAYYHLHKSLEYIKAHDFDVVHLHLSSTPDLYTFPLAASLDIPHVTTLHSHFPFDNLPGGWIGDADDYFIKDWASSNPLVAISESARKQAPSGLHFAGTIHNGLLLSQFQPNGQPADYFAWMGRFVREKGAHLAIQAAKATGVKLILAGIVSRNSQESMQYFREAIEPHIDNEQITYVGPVNMQQKIELLGRARALLNPIEWEEPFGMVMIEAMALSCPVIAFARGAAPEIVAHGKTGFLARDLTEMVHFIPRINEISREATRQHVEQHFSAHAMAEKYVKIYTKTIMKNKTAPKPLSAALTHRQYNSPSPIPMKPSVVAQARQQANEGTEKTKGKPASFQ